MSDLITRLRSPQTMSKFTGTADMYEELNLQRMLAADEIERLQKQVAIAEQALADLGVTPAEAKAGVERSNANKKDAERYRWLRAKVCNAVLHGVFDTVSVTRESAPGELDAALDAAMAEAMHANG